MAQTLSRQHLTAESRVPFSGQFMWDVSTIPRTLYIHLNLDDILTTRTEGQNLETFDHNSALVYITELQGTVCPQTDMAGNCCTAGSLHLLKTRDLGPSEG